MLGGLCFIEGECARALDVFEVEAFINKLTPKPPLNGICITSATTETGLPLDDFNVPNVLVVQSLNLGGAIDRLPFIECTSVEHWEHKVFPCAI